MSFQIFFFTICNIGNLYCFDFNLKKKSCRKCKYIQSTVEHLTNKQTNNPYLTLLISILCMKEKNSELMMSIQLILSKKGSGELTTRCILNKLLNSWKKGYVHYVSPPIFLTFRLSLLTWKIQRKLTFFNLALSNFHCQHITIITGHHFYVKSPPNSIFFSFFEFTRSLIFPVHISFWFFTFHFLVITLLIKNFLLFQKIFNFSRLFTFRSVQSFNFWCNVYIKPMLLKLGL